MSHESAAALTYQVTVPDEAGARAVADELAARGHRLVAVREVDWAHRVPGSSWFGKPSLRPADAGMWDVSSVVTGPMPDADERWWETQEDQAVRALAARFGGRTGGSGGGSKETVLQTFTRVGLVHELDDATVRQRRLAALAHLSPRAATDDAVGDPPDEDGLPSGPGEPVDLPGVDDTGWSALEHAYGPAGDVPAMLHGLAVNDDRWAEHLDELTGSVTHQGSSYSSTAPALRLVADLAVAPQLTGGRRLDLLYVLFLAGCAHDQAIAHDHAPEPHHQEVRDAVAAAVPQLLESWPTVSDAERRLLLLLAALATTEVPDHTLTDAASVLATATIAGETGAIDVLDRLARVEEGLVPLAGDATAPPRSRLVAALEVLLWVR